MTNYPQKVAEFVMAVEQSVVSAEQKREIYSQLA